MALNADTNVEFVAQVGDAICICRPFVSTMGDVDDGIDGDAAGDVGEALGFAFGIIALSPPPQAESIPAEIAITNKLFIFMKCI